MSEANNRAVQRGLIVAILALCLPLGCSNQPQMLDTYLDAILLRELGQEELAIEKLKVVTKADPDFVLAHMELGKAYRATGKNAEAAQAFRQAVRLDPWSFDGYINLARAYEDLGQFLDAARAYVRAGDLEPENLDAQVGAAKCFLEADQVVRALAHGEAAYQRDDQSREVVLLLGRIYEAQRDYPLAIRVYRQLLAVDPADAEVMLALGAAYMRDAQYGRAEEVLTSLVRIRPELTEGYRHLGYCFVNQGQADEAIRMYKKAIELDAEDWQAHRGLGVAYMVKAGRTDDAPAKAQAVDHWRRALEIDPNQPKREALEKLIREYSETTNPLQGLDY